MEADPLPPGLNGFKTWIYWIVWFAESRNPDPNLVANHFPQPYLTRLTRAFT